MRGRPAALLPLDTIGSLRNASHMKACASAGRHAGAMPRDATIC